MSVVLVVLRECIYAFDKNEILPRAIKMRSSGRFSSPTLLFHFINYSFFFISLSEKVVDLI